LIVHQVFFFITQAVLELVSVGGCDCICILLAYCL